MDKSTPQASAEAAEALRPAAMFRAALVAAAAEQRQARARNPERIAAANSLRDIDLARLVAEFEALLAAPPDVDALVDRLHAALRALAPELESEEVADADAN